MKQNNNITLLEKAKDCACDVHHMTNHKYDNRPYDIHLEMVVAAAEQFIII